MRGVVAVERTELKCVFCKYSIVVNYQQLRCVAIQLFFPGWQRTIQVAVSIWE